MKPAEEQKHVTTQLENNQISKPMRNSIQLPGQRTQQGMKIFWREELNHVESTIYSNVSRLNKVAESLDTTVDTLNRLPLSELIKLTTVFLGQEINQQKDYGFRRALKLYNQYAANTHAVQSIALPIPNRNKEGLERFLRNVYIRKTGEGDLLSVPQYLSYINSFEKVLGMYEGQIHTLSKWDVKRKIKMLEDKRMTLINSGHYLSAASAYEDYVAYTLGKYEPRMAA